MSNNAVTWGDSGALAGRIQEWFPTHPADERMLRAWWSPVFDQPRRPGDSPPDQVGTADEYAPYHTRYLDRPSHAGAAAAGSVSDIVAVEGSLLSLDGDSDRHTRFVSFDSDRDEAVVAVRATTSIQYIVSLATGLASPRFLDQALSPARLESLDDSTTVLR